MMTLPLMASVISACSTFRANPGAPCARDQPLRGATYAEDKSRFAFGSTPVKQIDGTLVRWVGSDGSIAIDADGSEGGALNGGAPEANLPDWSTDHDALAAHVNDYFLAMGVATCQIATSDISASGSAGGPSDGSSMTFTQGATTVNLARALDGISIVNSYAFARFDSEDESTAEGLYWPEIPVGVIETAIAFRDRLKDPQSLAAYKTKLPADAHGDGNVVIHHTRAGSTPPLRAAAVYEVLETPPDAGGLIGGKRGELDFDPDGDAVSDDW